MEKIKAVFSPGSSKDDEILYGNEEMRRKESLVNPTTEQPTKLYPVEGAAGQKESGGILSQITNPDGAKYDERAFETSATTAPDPNKLHTDPETKDRTILNQITNPGGHKYDEQKFGETATTVGTEHGHGKRGIGEKLYPEGAEGQNAAHYPGLGSAETAGTVSPNTKLETDADHKKDHSILRQILNPGGTKRDDIAYGTTAHATGDKMEAAHTGRSEPLPAAAGASTTLADRSTTTGQNKSSIAGPAYGETYTTGVNPGRGEPVIAGVGASTGPRYNEPQTDVLDRSHPLRDGSGAAAGTTNSALLGSGAVAAGGLAASSRAHDDAGTNAYGSSGLTSTLAGTTYGDHSGALGASGDTDRHHPDGRKLDCDGNPERGYVHHVAGPHSTDAANQLDPGLSNTSAPATRDRDENRGLAGGGVVGAVPPTTTSNTTGVSSGSGYPAGNASASGPGVVGSAAVPATMSSSNTGYAAGSTSTTGSSAIGSSNPSHSQQYAGASQSLQDPIGDRTTGHAHTRDEAEHEKKEKPSLIQKILHPGGHKEEKHTSHDEHSDQRTTVDDHGRNVLHKKSAPLESQAGNQAAAGPDWDAVTKAH